MMILLVFIILFYNYFILLNNKINKTQNGSVLSKSSSTVFSNINFYNSHFELI